MNQPLPNYPKTIHVYRHRNEKGGGFHYNIAEHNSWLPGLYASELAAVYALYFDDRHLRKLWWEVKFPEGADKYITVEDLNKYLERPDFTFKPSKK